jgi:Copper amine oxidase, enzyme domain
VGTAKNDRQVLVPGAVGETSAEAHSTNVLDYPSRMSEYEKESLVAEALAPLTVPLVDNIKLFSIEFLNSLPSIGCLIAHSPILMALQKVSQCATHNRIVIHHEDAGSVWPVMPTAWHEFELRPVNFFDHNPALDLTK